MSSSSKLSFQSGDSPSAGRKSWPGFHGLKALDFEEGSREQEHSHLLSPCLCTEQQDSLVLWASILHHQHLTPLLSCSQMRRKAPVYRACRVPGCSRVLPAKGSAKYLGHVSAMVRRGEEAHSKAITALRESQKPSSLPHAMLCSCVICSYFQPGEKCKAAAVTRGKDLPLLNSDFRTK